MSLILTLDFKDNQIRINNTELSGIDAGLISPVDLSLVIDYSRVEDGEVSQLSLDVNFEGMVLNLTDKYGNQFSTEVLGNV